ncbi:MAG TPA: UDP-N-acetylmuramate dehydrogenase, partial [bacterium]|nr:UDP-N-acetylmuramate dehydrogenase [bacterium]
SGFEHITREQEPLAPYTWFRLGGKAQYFAEPTSVNELQGLVQQAAKDKLAIRILGGGSNLLVRDEGVGGLVIHLAAAAFGKIAVEGKRIIAGGGAKLGHVISTAVREGLAGLEQLVGIPGTLGGALHTNAGSQNADIGQWTQSATVMTRKGDIVSRKREELRFGYRDSSLDELVVLEASLELEKGDPATLTKRMQQHWILKRAGQPLGAGGTGCIFKNPGGVSAASLIEEAELKGARVGDVEICDRSPNFILAGPRAKSRDVLELIEHVRKVVAEKTGTNLEIAIEIW